MARVLLHKPKMSRPVFWAGLCVAAAAVIVQVTHSGVDILALLLSGFVLLALERTLGDWIADSLGPAAAALVFAALAALGVWYVMSAGGRAKAQRFFAAAEARGYHTAYFTLDSVGQPRRGEEQSLGVADAVQSASDAVAPAPSDARAAPPPPRSTSASAAPTRAVPATGGTGGGSSGGGSAASTAGLPEGTSGGAPAGPGGRSEDRTLRVARLTVSPDIAMIGERVTFRAVVGGLSDSPLSIEFSVDGRVVSVAPVTADGTATANYSTRTPGQYTVRARISGGSLRPSEISARLSVLPGRR